MSDSRYAPRVEPDPGFADRLERDLLDRLAGTSNTITLASDDHHSRTWTRDLATTELGPTLRTTSRDGTIVDTAAASMPPDSRPGWLSIAAAAAVVTVIVGGLMLAARDDTGGVSDQQSAHEGVGTRVGFIGLPAEGATPSDPPGVPAVSISPCYAPIGDPSKIDALPPLGALWLFAGGIGAEGGDGRLIWQKFEDLPEGANSLSTGLLEQRLTPEGVELMQSEAIAAFNSGEMSDADADCHANRGYFLAVSPDGDQQDARFISADNEHLARIIDPWSWLPASAWKDAQIRAYVPYEYLVGFEVVGETVDVVNDEMTMGQLTAPLPAAAAHLIDIRFWNGPGSGGGGRQVVQTATFTIDDARALAAALDEAGLEQDELLNAYRLDYEFEYPDERLESPVHMWISANPPDCGLSMMLQSCYWHVPTLEQPDAIAASDGTAATETTAALATTASGDTPVGD